MGHIGPCYWRLPSAWEAVCWSQGVEPGGLGYAIYGRLTTRQLAEVEPALSPRHLIGAARYYETALR
jgi:hypothetical protein